MDTTACKLPAGGEGGFCMLWVEWNPSSFKILVLLNGSAWNGHASDNHIQQLSQLLQLSVKDYMTETKNALSTQGGLAEYTYLVEDCQFVWKKLDQCSKVRVKYGYIQLEEISYHEAAEKMMDCLLQQCSSLTKEVVGLQKTNITARKERAVFMEKLVKYKEEKLEMEKQLTGRFLAVLNTKKDYIKQLEDRLEIGSTQPAVSKRSNCKPVQQDSIQCHYDSDTELETTDDERKDDISFLRETDRLSDDTKAFSNVPKHINRCKKHIMGSVAGPSSKKVSGSIVGGGHGEQFGTQDLLDDL